MKTAMELALARIELMKDISPDSIRWQMFKENYIQQEKEQIEKAFYDGYYQEELYDAKRYYDDTYNQNK
jgi:hypothetical protein